MTQKSRAVRFSDQEEEEIQRFLELNPFLDFSTLARVAIKRFMENPQIEMKPIAGISDVKIKRKSAKSELNSDRQ